ncbi:hypothetical protein [Paenibacillus thiaminolyticus]|uniref:Uncharacterized protein n=1 Tax=Paenibacillus thiaminolyticus TaxID=49283 RepID=A0A3A3GCH0_PANTH|nr:hypothetical protein [Paenibacillus thiaminolyticus]RJG21374.1 hypothetical protein DQX05_22000 [Paenibacillus thiaminolyticus]
MMRKARWLKEDKDVIILSEDSKSLYSPQVRIRDGINVYYVPRKELLYLEDEELLERLKEMLILKNPSKHPQYFSTVKQLLRSGAPMGSYLRSKTETKRKNVSGDLMLF